MISTLKIADPGSEVANKIGTSLWIVFVITFLSNMMAGNVSTLMAVYLPVVVTDLLGNSNADYMNEVSAYISALYLFGWTIGGFFWGLISDRIGRVRSFILSFGIVGIFTSLTGLMTSWELVVALRFMTGFCVGGVLVITNTYMTEIWPEKTRAIFIGWLSIGFPIGIVSAGITNYLFKSWNNGFFIGLIPVILAFVSIWLLRESDKAGSGALDAALQPRLKQVFNDNHTNLIKGSIIFGSMLIGMWAVFSWLPTWTQTLLKNSDGQRERSLCMMLMGLGGLSGGFFSGWIARGIGLRKSMLICFAGCLITAFVMFSTNQTFSVLIYVETGILAIFFGISQGALGTYIPQLFLSRIRGTATGFCYNIGRIVTALTVFFVGTLVTVLGGYSNSLMVFSLVFLFGLITIYFSMDLKLKTKTKT